MAVLTLFVMSCNRDKVSDADLVVVDHGNMSFYDVEAQKLIPYEKETDSVLNLLFDDNSHLYYTVTKGDNLLLKMVDMNQSSPTPKECAYWNMGLMNALDEMTGEVSSIFWDKSGENIIIYKTDYEDYTLSALLYNVGTGKVSAKNYDEAFDLRGFGYEKDFDPSHFYIKDKQFYYVKPEGEVCLTDKIDFRQVFEDEAEMEDLYFNPEALSPNGQTLVYSATIFWGEGWGYYGLANTDGSSQWLLKDSDIWDFTPSWLADGSLVYVGKTARPKTDPEYDEEWNNTQPCINLIGPDKSTKTLSLGKTFAVRPFGEKKASVIDRQGSLEGCDVALLDNGKVTFYNSTTGEFVPFVVETDSVINGVFLYGDDFYYTVSIGNRLYLKEIYMSDYITNPSMRTSWDLNLDDCVSQTYGRASTLAWIPAFDRIGISYNFSWDYYNFADIRFYAYYENTLIDGWSEEEDAETDVLDEEFMKYLNDLEYFVADEGRYYYKTEEGEACLTDKINFEDYCSEPDYCEEPEFVFYSINPTRTCVAYATLVEWGDLGHGPLCMSSLDGKMQLAFGDTDAADMTWGWMPDGSMLYVSGKEVMIVHPDGSEESFAQASDFVVSTK